VLSLALSNRAPVFPYLLGGGLWNSKKDAAGKSAMMREEISRENHTSES
jgi:hypothetical protein